MKYTSKLLHFAAVALYAPSSDNSQVIMPETSKLTNMGILADRPLMNGVDSKSRNLMEKDLYKALEETKQPLMSTEGLVFTMPEYANLFHHDVLVNINNFYTLWQNISDNNKLALKLLFRSLYPVMRKAVYHEANAVALKEMRAELAAQDITLASCTSDLENDIFNGRASEASILLKRWQFLSYAAAGLDELGVKYGIPSILNASQEDLVNLANEPIQRLYAKTTIINDKTRDTQEFNQRMYDSFSYEAYLLDLLSAHKKVNGDTTYANGMYKHNNFQTLIATCYAHILARGLAYHVIAISQEKESSKQKQAANIITKIMAENITVFFNEIATLLRSTVYFGKQIPFLDTIENTNAMLHISSEQMLYIMSIFTAEVKAMMTSLYVATYRKMPVDNSLHTNILHIQEQPNPNKARQATIPGIHACLSTLVRYCQVKPYQDKNNVSFAVCKENTNISVRAALRALNEQFLKSSIEYVNNKMIGLTKFLLKRALINITPVNKKQILESTDRMLDAITQHTYLSGGESMRISINNIVPLPYSVQPWLFNVIFQTERFARKYAELIKVPVEPATETTPEVASYVPAIAQSFFIKSVFSKNDSPWLKLAEDFFGKNNVSFINLLEPKYNIDNNHLGVKTYRKIIEQILGIISVTNFVCHVKANMTYKVNLPKYDKDFDSVEEEYKDAIDNMSSDINVTMNFQSIMDGFYASYQQADTIRQQAEEAFQQAKEAKEAAIKAVKTAKTGDTTPEDMKALKEKVSQTDTALQAATKAHLEATEQAQSYQGLINKKLCIIFNNVIFLRHAHECSTPEELAVLMKTGKTIRDVKVPNNPAELATYVREQLGYVIPEVLLESAK